MKAIGSSITAGGSVPKNKAMRQALADHLGAEQAGFQNAANAFVTEAPGGSRRRESKSKAKPKAKVLNFGFLRAFTENVHSVFLFYLMNK